MSGRTSSPEPFGLSTGTQPRETSHLPYNEGTVCPRTPSHTAPPGSSPVLASTLGVSPLTCLCRQVPVVGNPLLSQEHWVPHAHCSRGTTAAQEHLWEPAGQRGAHTAPCQC